MTYEKFANTLTSEDDTISRQEIKSFTIKYTLLFSISAISISSLVSEILGGTFCGVLLILSLFLYIFSFDVISENTNTFNILQKLSKVWWLLSLIIIVSSVLVRIFLL